MTIPSSKSNSNPNPDRNGKHPLGPETHLSLEDLATLCEAVLPGPGDPVDESRIPEGASQHLTECDDCTAAFEEAVRVRASWLTGTMSEPIEGELRELALRQGETWARDRRAALAGDAHAPASQTYSQHTSQHSSQRTPHQPARRPLEQPSLAFSRFLRVFALPGAALAAVGLWILLRPTTGIEEQAYLPPEILRAAVIDASGTGLVLPGGGSGPAGDSQYRSGGAITPALRDLLDSANTSDSSSESVSADPGSARDAASVEATVWIIAGELSAGRNRVARIQLDAALRHHPDELRLQTLSAIARYRQNDLAGAERELRAVLDQSPADDVARFDLAFVLFEAGRSDEARDELWKVRSLPNTQLQQRVSELREALAEPHSPSSR